MGYSTEARKQHEQKSCFPCGLILYHCSVIKAQMHPSEIAVMYFICINVLHSIELEILTTTKTFLVEIWELSGSGM